LSSDFFLDPSTPMMQERILSGPRVVVDGSTGEAVSIVERRTDGVAGAPRSSCLIYSTDVGFTRIWNYPERWEELSDDDLMGLVDQLQRPRRARSA
jgi:hypothetical protein